MGVEFERGMYCGENRPGALCAPAHAASGSDYVLGYVVDMGIEAGGLDTIVADPVAVPQIERRVPVAAAAQHRLVGMWRLPGRQKPVGIHVGGATNIVRGRMLRRALAREYVRNDDYEDQKADKQEDVAVLHYAATSVRMWAR